MLENLKNILEIGIENLPGKEVQYLMAPSDRNSKITVNKTRKGAVLILLSEKKGEIFLTLIIRQEYDGAHSGQIAFPGGKYEKLDCETKQTAIRECFEEIGIDEDNYQIIGSLTKLFIPVSAFEVFPYIAIVKNNLKYIKQDYEVKEVIEIRLKDFLNKDNIKKEFRTFKGNEYLIPYYAVAPYKIWGATAMIIKELTEIINRSNYNLINF
jgi:8-oxo-dGTP pyrophosphatase MutT (NUDIX family)